MIKQGIVSHGYQLNGELDLWQDWKARGLDKAFSRGELAVEPNPLNGTCAQQLPSALPLAVPFCDSLRGCTSGSHWCLLPNSRPSCCTDGNWAYSPAWSLQANAEWALTWGLAM